MSKNINVRMPDSLPPEVYQPTKEDMSLDSGAIKTYIWFLLTMAEGRSKARGADRREAQTDYLNNGEALTLAVCRRTLAAEAEVERLRAELAALKEQQG